MKSSEKFCSSEKYDFLFHLKMLNYILTNNF